MIPPSSNTFSTTYQRKSYSTEFSVPLLSVVNMFRPNYIAEHYLTISILNCTTSIILLAQQHWLDPFMGTGATGESALKLARDFVGIDISAKFCKLALARLDKHIAQERLF
jgi:hypothetical protein